MTDREKALVALLAECKERWSVFGREEECTDECHNSVAWHYRWMVNQLEAALSLPEKSDAPPRFQHKKGCGWANELPTGVGYFGCNCGLDVLLLQLEDYETPAAPVAEPSDRGYIDIVFDGPPGPECGRFVEVEDQLGRGMKLGEWLQREDGYWVIRVQRAEFAAVRASSATLTASETAEAANGHE